MADTSALGDTAWWSKVRMFCSFHRHQVTSSTKESKLLCNGCGITDLTEIHQSSRVDVGCSGVAMEVMALSKRDQTSQAKTQEHNRWSVVSSNWSQKVQFALG
jgi:hypothetical protein